MAIIRPGSFSFPRQWNPTQVPTWPVELDTTNALSTGLGDFAVFATGKNYSAPGFAPYNAGSVPFKSAARGAASSTPGTLADYAALPQRTNLATPLFTVSLLFQPISVSAAYAVLWDKGTAGDREMALFVDTSLNFNYCCVGKSFTALAITSGMNFGGVYEVTMTRDGANLVTIYVNGASVGTVTISATTTVSVQTAFGANISGAGANTAANFFRWATWQGVCLTANQVSELATEPFAMLRPVVRRSYFVAAAGGGYAGTLALVPWHWNTSPISTNQKQQINAALVAWQWKTAPISTNAQTGLKVSAVVWRWTASALGTNAQTMLAVSKAAWSWTARAINVNQQAAMTIAVKAWTWTGRSLTLTIQVSLTLVTTGWRWTTKVFSGYGAKSGLGGVMRGIGRRVGRGIIRAMRK